MALDTKTKRGSAIGIGLPFRPWLAEPSGTLDAGDRLSLLKLCAAPGLAAVIGYVRLTTAAPSVTITVEAAP